VPETTARRVQKTMAIAVVPLTDAWAVRELTICLRSMKELPLYARQLVEHLRTKDIRPGEAGEGDREKRGGGGL
jgi:hypothetical protein